MQMQQVQNGNPGVLMQNQANATAGIAVANANTTVGVPVAAGAGGGMQQTQEQQAFQQYAPTGRSQSRTVVSPTDGNGNLTEEERLRTKMI